MSLNSLKVPKGAKATRKRVGRGQASGLGKTAGRGGKGQKARSGNMRFEGFEGGQMPLQRRLPKFGFKNIHRREFAEVQVASLEGTAGVAAGVVDVTVLRANGLVRGAFDGVVLLGGGELTKKLTVKVDRVTKGARAAVEKAGGTVELLPAPVTMHQQAKAAKRAAKAKA
jgi:large subunit ribosomal protein L15